MPRPRTITVVTALLIGLIAAACTSATTVPAGTLTTTPTTPAPTTPAPTTPAPTEAPARPAAVSVIPG